jgi:hypothetical protein
MGWFGVYLLVGALPLVLIVEMFYFVGESDK